MRLVLIDASALLFLDSWSVPAIPRLGELVELRNQNWRVVAIKWVKSTTAETLSDPMKKLLGCKAVNVNEVFAAAFLKHEPSENEGTPIPLLTPDNVKEKEP